ncbi:hypothetical protein [Azospirillum aestuarii]|uniref:hypothetical protein n=1 Tax=Azospirillum aestuarii TaxID=2802052 RepID=UPI004054F739
MAARFRFYADFTDKWGDLQTINVLADSAEDAERRLRWEAGNFIRNFKFRPDWDLIVFDDGTLMLRAEWEQFERRQGMPAAAAE